jgi:lactoylglutathione lyase
MTIRPNTPLIIFAVSDLRRSVGFYRAVFGWTAHVETPVYVEFAISNGLRFGLYDRTSFGNNTGQVPELLRAGAIAPTELYLYPEDAAETLSRLERAGARLLSGRAHRSWGDEVAYVTDLDGNVLAIARSVSAS